MTVTPTKLNWRNLLPRLGLTGKLIGSENGKLLLTEDGKPLLLELYVSDPNTKWDITNPTQLKWS